MSKAKRIIEVGGRKFGRTIKFRLRVTDAKIEQVLSALPDGELSEFIRDAIRKKIEGGSTVETVLEEIRELRKSLNQRQAE